METLNFEELPRAISILLDKVTRLEELIALNNSGNRHAERSINVEEAAKFLDIAVQTLYGKVSRKEVPVNKQGKHLHFYVSELEEWLRQGRRKTIAEVQQRTEVILRRRK